MKLLPFGDIYINPEQVVALEAIRVIKPGSPPGVSFAEREEIDATRVYMAGGKVFTIAERIADLRVMLR